MEKRRRARINQCLDELKSLILEAMKKDVSSVIVHLSGAIYQSLDNSDFRAIDRSVRPITRHAAGGKKVF